MHSSRPLSRPQSRGRSMSASRNRGTTPVAPTRQQGNANLKVAFRLRPLTNREAGSPIIVSTSGNSVFFQKADGRSVFKFDSVFDRHSTQHDVFNDIGPETINSFLAGTNISILTYGSTGTGKSYTLFGVDPKGPGANSTIAENDMPQSLDPSDSVGLIPRLLESLINSLSNSSQQVSLQEIEQGYEGWNLSLQFVELYNEKIYDLLEEEDYNKTYEIRGIPPKIEGVKTIDITDIDLATDIINFGIDNRSTRATYMNDVSSRSHSILSLRLTRRQSSPNRVTRSTLHLVDLAGSEKLIGSLTDEGAITELTNINRSLSTLGKVVRALAKNDSHIPYRESKLTRLLQDSLGGNALTTFIITASASAQCADITSSALNFAGSVKNISVNISSNIELADSELIKGQTQEIYRLEKQLEEMTIERIRLQKELESRPSSSSGGSLSRSQVISILNPKFVRIENAFRDLLGDALSHKGSDPEFVDDLHAELKAILKSAAGEFLTGLCGAPSRSTTPASQIRRSETPKQTPINILAPTPHTIVPVIPPIAKESYSVPEEIQFEKPEAPTLTLSSLQREIPAPTVTRSRSSSRGRGASAPRTYRIDDFL